MSPQSLTERWNDAEASISSTASILIYASQKHTDFCKLADLMSSLFHSHRLNNRKTHQHALSVVGATKEQTVSSVQTEVKLLSEAVCSLNLAGHKAAIKI